MKNQRHNLSPRLQKFRLSLTWYGYLYQRRDNTIIRYDNTNITSFRILPYKMSMSQLMPNWRGIKKMIFHMLSSALGPFLVLTRSCVSECSEVGDFTKNVPLPSMRVLSISEDKCRTRVTL